MALSQFIEYFLVLSAQLGDLAIKLRAENLL